MFFDLYCTPAKEVQLFSGLGLYSGIFAMYLQCSSNKSGTANIVSYALCLLYVLSTATVVFDVVSIIVYVSNNPFSEKIIFFISCAVVYQYTITSTSNWLKSNDISSFDYPIHGNWMLWLHRSMYPSTHKPLYPIIDIRFIHLNLQKDLPLLDRVGSKYPRRGHSFIHGNHILGSVNLSPFNTLILT